MAQSMSATPFEGVVYASNPPEPDGSVSSHVAQPTWPGSYSSVIANLSDALRMLQAQGAPHANAPAISAITSAMNALQGSFGAVSRRKSGGLAGWQCAALRRYVGENMQNRICISDLAETIKLSTSHFCRAFRVSFDCSPTQFIMQERVERARTKLLETSDTLSQIAFDCGFSDQSHFSRIFHDATGETPWRWRKERVAGRNVQ